MNIHFLNQRLQVQHGIEVAKNMMSLREYLQRYVELLASYNYLKLGLVHKLAGEMPS